MAPVRHLRRLAYVSVDLSDHASFWDEGYPAAMLTDTALPRNPRYHQADDTWDTLDYPLMARTVEAVHCAVEPWNASVRGRPGLLQQAVVSSAPMFESTPPPASSNPTPGPVPYIVGVLLSVGSLPCTGILLLAESGRRFMAPEAALVIMFGVAAAAFCFAPFVFGHRRWLVPLLACLGIAAAAFAWALSIAPLGQYRG